MGGTFRRHKCAACGVRVFNRGCGDCTQRLCKFCFHIHVCPLASVEKPAIKNEKAEAAEEKTKEEADRKVEEENQRKAKEEADRKAEEEKQRKAKEEADRKAEEEKQRKAKEEADRKA